METYFLNLLILLCGHFPDTEKAICIYDMTSCRTEINYTYGHESEPLLYKHCLIEKYLGYYNWPQINPPINQSRNQTKENNNG